LIFNGIHDFHDFREAALELDIRGELLMIIAGRIT
jgi:hypothetical protein